MKMKRIALSCIGKDRPGIVSAVSALLFKHKCNIEDSSMTILKGEFAMIMIVGAPAMFSLKQFEAECRSVGKSEQLHISCKALEAAIETKEANANEGERYMISLLGADQPGLVYKVTKLLAENDINISDVNTKKLGDGAKPSFAMLIEFTLQANGTSLESLKEALDNLAKTLDAEISVKPIDIAQM